MKEKFNNIIESDEKRAFIILIIVTVIIVSSVLTIYLLTTKSDKKDDITTTTKVSTTDRKDIFKGYKTYEIDYEKDISYDLEKRHEFIFATDNDETIIYTRKDDLELFYELSLVGGSISFQEQRYNNELKAYEFTGKKYSYKKDKDIVAFKVVKTCSNEKYAIIAMDTAGNVYSYETPEEEYNIVDILNNFKLHKTISKAKRVGYYNLSNVPNIDCEGYILVYEDISNNIRTLEKKNPLFFDTAYYRYLGKNYSDQYIYVFKDGKMKYDIGNNEKFINDGNYHIYYRGYFYEETSVSNNIYIISKDGYLYKIENMNEESSQILTKMNDSRIKKVGTKVIKTTNDFATDKLRLIIEFDTEDILEIEEISDFELIS